MADTMIGEVLFLIISQCCFSCVREVRICRPTIGRALETSGHLANSLLVALLQIRNPHGCSMLSHEGFLLPKKQYDVSS